MSRLDTGPTPADLADVYDGLAEGWDADARQVYGPLARTLVASSPISLRGRLVLDAGSGTGAVAAAAAAAGAQVIAADRAEGMLAHQGTRRWPVVVTDARALSIAGATFDAALSGFLVNHLEPVAALVELARVVRPGGAVVATTWAAGTDVVKAAVDAVISAHGWVRPAWYQAMRAEVDRITGVAEGLAAAAEEARLSDVVASVQHPDLGVRDAAVLVAYRLSLPHVAPWVAGLGRTARATVTNAACAAVAPHIEAWRPAVIVLTGRVS